MIMMTTNEDYEGWVTHASNMNDNANNINDINININDIDKKTQ